MFQMSLLFVFLFHLFSTAMILQVTQVTSIKTHMFPRSLFNKYTIGLYVLGVRMQ